MWYRHNQRWLQASEEGAEASKSGSFKDEREWGKKCFEDLDQRRMGRPATSTRAGWSLGPWPCISVAGEAGAAPRGVCRRSADAGP